MKRRAFLEISASASAVILVGGITGFSHPNIVDSEDDFQERFHRLGMHGGCGDYRMMGDRIPGFLEREIFDNLA